MTVSGIAVTTLLEEEELWICNVLAISNFLLFVLWFRKIFKSMKKSLILNGPFYNLFLLITLPKFI